MKAKKCVGCGATLQSNDKSMEGYVPEQKLVEGGELYCMRCFKIRNYGEYLPISIDIDTYRAEVMKGLSNANLVLPIFDIIDFESSFDDEILDILRENDSIVIVNKMDLIPQNHHPSQIADFVKRRLAEEGISPLDIAVVSSHNGYGINGIYKKINHFYPDGVTALVLGVTNVGKSSIVNRLTGNSAKNIKSKEQKNKEIVESKYPGTTLKCLERLIPGTNINIIDTPGLIPAGRMSDLVCESCGERLVPSTGLIKKTFKLKTDRVITIEKLMNISTTEGTIAKPVFSLYTSKNIMIHETRHKRLVDIVASSENSILTMPCDRCADSFGQFKKEKRIVSINPGEDLAIHGLGWISVKHYPVELELYLPRDVKTTIRKSLLKD